jgi:2-hydroxychromene-2-carboxylate isomerase
MSRVAVFFDTVSPYSFIGVETLLRYRAVWGDMVKVELIPFFLGGVMKVVFVVCPSLNISLFFICFFWD